MSKGPSKKKQKHIAASPAASPAIFEECFSRDIVLGMFCKMAPFARFNTSFVL